MAGSEFSKETFCLMWHCYSPGISKQQVRVNFQSKFNRKSHAEHDVKIEELWRGKLSGDVTLYNGMKFRLAGMSEDAEKAPSIELDIGLTCYRDFQCTNYSSESERLRSDGLRDFNESQAYMSDPLGVSAILITSDDKVVVEKRSTKVGEYCNMLDLPGGHAEPSNVPGWKQEYEGNVQCQDAFLSLKSSDIVNEIFDSIVQEVVAELNIPRDQLSEPHLVGILRQMLSFGRPSTLFVVKAVDIRENDVRRMYGEGGEEQFESVDIEFVSLEDIQCGTWRSRSEQFTPSAHAAFYIIAQSTKATATED
ncbi:uridine diphosphate glucose pyrophosphatase NUDT22-like [Corticium candelabrum]|uniref:uridine diphosphate glucose pyrophosphatase NUDT22-like n=1 Tax=Corticium candelabrum TaxID=121492 RepID=UPI002E261B48|nr:uridine diphosphate glucose pyrophosphatase NUDT22-like [Corticium candelabrum]